MRTFAAVTVAGVTGVVLLKLITAIFIPILGVLVGLFAMTVKFAFIAAVIFFVYSMIRKRREEKAA